MRNILGLLLLLVSFGLAQDCKQTVPITLLTDKHQPPALPAERLQASIEGHPVVISRVEKIAAMRILLLVDVSGSMTEVKFLPNLVEALLGQIPSGSSLAYGFFNDNVKLSDRFTGNPEEIRAVLIQLPGVTMRGRTALHDALDSGLGLFQRPMPGDSIFIVSDGGENRSRVSEKQLKTRLRESGIRLFAIVPIHKTPFPEEEIGPPLLPQLAADTGGGVLYLKDFDTNSSVTTSIRAFWLEAVANGYLLTIHPPSSLNKPTRWKLRLDTSGDKQFKGVSVSYPEELMPCSNAAASAR